MTPESLLEELERLPGGSEAVLKMRELVLELAVRGKLVEQNPADGEGDTLLNQIRKKRRALGAEAEGAETAESELKSLPKNWARSSLGEVAEIIRGVSFPGSAKSQSRSDDEVACLRTASVQAEIDWEDLIFVSPTYVGRQDQWVAPNDILISMANSRALVGKVAIVRQVPQKATFGAFLAAIRPLLIEPFFLLYVLRSPHVQSALRAGSTQTTNIANISLRRMRPLPVPLPPLAEQKRIVAKVGEIMALCDRLEAQQSERETKHAALVRASVTRFAEAPTTANLSLLFHKSYTVSPVDLRNVILDLAVRGKLVPQDSTDEPAVELLARLKEFKASHPLVGRRGRNQRSTEPPRRTGAELPSNWVNATIGEVVHVIRGASPRPKGDPRYFAESRTPYHWVKISDIRKHARDGLLMDSDEFLTEAGMRKSVLLPKGTLVLTNSATIGVPVVLGVEGCCIHDGFLAFPNFPNQLLSQRFLTVVFHSLRTHAERSARGLAQLNLNTKLVSSFQFGLPPLEEQKRIVAKVDQLLTLTDRLEVQLAESRATALRLLDAVVGELAA